MAKPATVDAYLASLPDDRRAAMAQIREAVREAAPGAEEVITYGMPGLRLDGRFLVSYDAFTAHYSLFPASQGVLDALGDEVAPHVAGRGTLRFAADAQIPTDLIRRIVLVRLEEHRAAR